MITELPFHDAHFTGVVLQDVYAALHFKCVDGTSRVVHLTGVDAMQMEDFREGNIVGCFEIISAELPRGFTSWERLYPGPHPSAAEEYHRKHEEFLRRKCRGIEEGRLTFVQLSPILGADLLAVCERVQIKD